jgi:hypothetical protein
MFQPLLGLNYLLLTLAAAKRFTETCEEVHIPEHNTVLNATCDKIDKVKMDTSIALKDCLPCSAFHIDCSWEICTYNATADIAQCRQKNQYSINYKLGR